MTLDDCALTAFHIRVALAGTGGQFSDGYILGIIGISLAVAAPYLHLDAIWLGLLGAASLAGLFAGSLFSGPILDRFGRRGLFNYDMAVFAIISVLQFWANTAAELLVLRLLLGVVLGFDYVVSKALVIEYAPRRWRGRLLSGLGIAWALGYLGAYVAGYLLKDHGPDAWRLMLVSSAVPSAVVFLFRVGIPESPLWLQRKGRREEAMAIIRRYLGPNVTLGSPAAAAGPGDQEPADAKLFSGKWRSRLFSACFFYTCLVVPYYALGTFSPLVFASLGVKDEFLAGLIYNIFLLIGAVAGALIIDRISRRSFLLGGYFLCAIVLAALVGEWVSARCRNRGPVRHFCPRSQRCEQSCLSLSCGIVSHRDSRHRSWGGCCGKPHQFFGGHIFAPCRCSQLWWQRGRRLLYRCAGDRGHWGILGARDALHIDEWRIGKGTGPIQSGQKFRRCDDANATD